MAAKNLVTSIDPPPGAPGVLRLLKAAHSPFQPDIWIVDTAGTPRVWKTWHRRPRLERRLVGIRLARHEGHIMRRLAGLGDMPTFLSHPHPWTLEMTLLDAEPVPDRKEGCVLSATYFARLEKLLAGMHARGINHGDLRRKNLLRAPGDRDTPRLVDFTQCICFGNPPGGLRGLLFRQAVRIDRVTFLKLKQWYLGHEALTPAEIAEAGDVPWHLSLGRFLRKRLYKPWRRRRVGKGGRRKDEG